MLPWLADGTLAATQAMKPACLSVIVLVLALSLSACRRKTDVKGSIAELEKAFPAAVVTVSLDMPQSPSAPTRIEAEEYIRAALTAVRAQDYGSGVMVLEELQRKRGLPGITANQLMTIEQTKEAMISELVARAAHGDPKSIDALAAIERTHSQ